jgi:zinc D-Ala-D-Ala carboxypeptidase
MSTEHFKDSEFLGVGTHYSVDNTPNETVLANIHKMQVLLEKARDIVGGHFGRDIPISVRYGYRSPALNHQCGGSKTSAHLEGLGADTRFGSYDLNEIAQVLFKHDTFMEEVDQLIIENGCLHFGLPCKASGYQPRHELRKDAYSEGRRTYPLVAIWHR